MSATGRFEFQRALDRATGARAIQGNRLTLLCDGPEIFAAMHEMIAAAERSVHFENYIIRSDRTGWDAARALAKKAREGVAVRVLYDAVGSRSTSRKLWAFLHTAGVEVRRFHPLLGSGPVQFVQRDHRKLVVVDGHDALIGGFCIGDEWAGDATVCRPPWRDTAVRIVGPAARAADETFRRLWALTGPGIHDLPAPAREPAGDASVRVVAGVPGRSSVYRSLALLAAGATGRLWLTDAYFVPPPPLLASLVAAARDGVDVRLLVPGRTDLPIIRLFTRAGYRDFLRGGLRIYEWQGSMLHAKSFVTDGVWARVGSSNMNLSSLFGNYELDVLAEEHALAAALADQFRRDLAGAAEIVVEPRRRLPSRLKPERAVSAALPPTVGSRSGPEARRAAVLTLRQVAAGARRSLVGAAVFSLMGAAVLLLALPRVMGWLLAALAFWLAAVAAWAGLARRRQTRAEVNGWRAGRVL